MKEREFAAALQIMRALMKHRAAAPFCGRQDTSMSSFFSVGNDDEPDLTSIFSRLLARRFASLDEFERTIERVWQKSIHISQHHEILSRQMQKVYAREKRKVMIGFSLPEWSTEICRLRDKLGRLTYFPPRSALLSGVGLDPKKTLDAQLPKDTDYAQFLTAAQRLTSVDDQEALMRLIESEQPELATSDSRVEVNLLALKPATFVMARDFLRKRLKIDYRDFWE
jgi:hypothetical protein